jgi:beta-glucanase (GH16 family)
MKTLSFAFEIALWRQVGHSKTSLTREQFTMTALRLFLASLPRTKPASLMLVLGGSLLFGLLGAGAPTAQAQTLSLVWSDEFNSVTSSNVDNTKWTFESGNNGGWGNNELEFYTSRTNNAYVGGGLLHIHAQVENTNGFRFTSARMKTQGLFWTTYGRIEWRAKFPSGTGMWPALWMMGTNIANLGWPGCGEIDVVENNGTPNFEQGSIHSGSDATKVFNFAGGDSVTNFHVYDLDWVSNSSSSVSITWSVDGTAYETQTSWTSSTGNPYPFPFNQPFFLLMNLATGGNYVGNPSTNAIAASLPQEIQVDYVRVYQFAAPTVIPSTVTGLVATASGSSVTLNWNAAANASSYNVKRSLTNGGPYTTNANTAATSFTDTNVTNCTTYYYVVSGVNNIGEGTNSNQAAASVAGYSYYFAVNSGGSAASPFVADTDEVGGTVAATSTATIVTSSVTNPAPQAVYKTERYGNFAYTFSGLATGVSYTVRLHEAEIHFTGTGQREFNVFINGRQVLTNFDILARAGGENIAVIEQYAVTPMANGQISITYSNGAVDQAKSSGIEIIVPSPAAPVGVTATGEVGQVALAWNPVAGATSYDIGRALNTGGPYTNLMISGITATNYTDTGLASGTTYYYVVSAVAGVCDEGTNSAEVSATTTVTGAFAAWQTQYFGSTTNPLAAANVDADGTGQNNQFKYVAGLDPTNPSSIFVLTIASVTNQPSQMNLIFNPMVGGRTYAPQFSTDMVSGVWTQLVGYAGPVTNGSQATITDMNAVPSNEFYRIDISCTNCP